MYRNKTIQNIFAVLLLVVFTISIAPRTHFHDLVANHKDLPACNQLHTNKVLHTTTYHCHFDDLVVLTPFVLQTEQSFSLGNLCFETKKAAFYTSSYQLFLQHKESRGPPTI